MNISGQIENLLTMIVDGVSMGTIELTENEQAELRSLMGIINSLIGDGIQKHEFKPLMRLLGFVAELVPEMAGEIAEIKSL